MSRARAEIAELSNADQTRRRLHAAVVGCVERWGIEKTTLNDIAKMAGCSRQTVYNYFPGKAEVVESALAEAGREFLERVEEHALKFEEPQESLLEVVMYTLKMLPREPFLHFLTDPVFFVTFKQGFFGSKTSRARMQEVIGISLRNAPELSRYVPEISEVTGRFMISMFMDDGGVNRSEKQLREFIRRRILPGLLQP